MTLSYLRFDYKKIPLFISVLMVGVLFISTYVLTQRLQRVNEPVTTESLAAAGGCSVDSYDLKCDNANPGDPCGGSKVCKKADTGLGSDGKDKCKCIMDTGSGTLTPFPTTYRPDLCSIATTTANYLAPGDKATIRLLAKTNVRSYHLRFYNLGNLYPAPPTNNPKQYYKVANVWYGRDLTTGAPLGTNTQDFLVTYSEINAPDLHPDWGGKGVPPQVQINAYFTSNNGDVSKQDPNCVVKITRFGPGTPTPTNIPPVLTLTPTPTTPYCPQVITCGKNVATGQCKIYNTACLPTGWVPTDFSCCSPTGTPAPSVTPGGVTNTPAPSDIATPTVTPGGVTNTPPVATATTTPTLSGTATPTITGTTTVTVTMTPPEDDDYDETAQFFPVGTMLLVAAGIVFFLMFLH